MRDIPGYTLDVLVSDGVETALFRGRRDRDGARVAAKVTRSDYPTWRHLSRLRREHAILRELDLPGVPRVLDLVEHGRGLALIMEDLGPTSLASLIEARGRLDATTALRIAIPLVRTLDALHQKRFVHKDIKPRNVMMDEATLSPRLVDFGITARLAQEGAAPEELAGTLAYIAPEQTGRMNRPVDLRADLYSMGVTLYEMLTGAPPFTTADPTEAIHAHLTRAPVPPHLVTAGVPRGLSDVVMRLLAKTPENRYQSARGLLCDLQECMRRITASGSINPFLLGREDFTDRVVLPDRLVGREVELKALAAALDRARMGAPTWALVAGPSGIGKSALVRELVAVSAQAATFASGKFDPMARSMPLSAVSQAIRALVRRKLAEPAAILEALKRDIAAALGRSGRVVTDLCPELEIILGPQGEPPPLGPNEAKNRFALLMRRFLSVFAHEAAPLVLFFDDLQWADAASLELLGRLLSDPDMHHLLVVGAYRDDEVDAGHPLSAAMNALRKTGIEPFELAVGPLAREAVAAVVAEALHAEVAAVEPLAAVIWDKTHGNPFFLGQFLRALADDGWLRFDPEVRRFVWDLEQVKGAMVTSNVLALVARKIERLAPRTRRALMLASCIGPTFDLSTLSTVLESPRAAAAADLWEALREGFVVPLGGDYRLLDVAADVPAAMDVSIEYRFLHDRVQEACYALVPDAERAALHLAIGRLLLKSSGEQVPDDRLLELTRHLNLGAQHIADQAARMDLARLDLRAGKRAKAATAYEAAAQLFAAGRSFAGPDGFSRDHETCFALWLQGAECEWLSGAHERADALMDELLVHARSALERARVHDLRISSFMTRGRFADAVKAGLEGLAGLGVTMPETDGELQMAFGQGLGTIAALLRERRIDDLASAPLIDDPQEKAIQKLLGALSTPAYFVNPMLYGPLNIEGVRRSLVHGHTEMSPFAYMAYGFMLGAILGQHAQGVAFGRLALAMADEWKSVSLAAKLHIVFAYFMYVREPLRAALPHAERSLSAALEAGDFVFLASCSYATPPLLIAAGLPLEEVHAETEKCLAHAKRTKDVLAIAAITIAMQMVNCLLGRTNDPTSFDAEGFDEAAELAALDEKNHAIAFFYYHAYKVLLHLLHGDPAAALASAAQAEQRGGSVMGLYWTVNVPFLAALAHASLARTADTEAARREHEAAIGPLRAKLEPLAESCPSNFRHRLLLLDAELGTLAGSGLEPVKLYEQAVQLARENNHPHDEAIASERCGRFLLGAGLERAARGYLIDAYRGYRHWGAVAKARALAEELPDVLAAAVSERTTTNAGSSVTGNVTSGTTLLGRASSDSLRDAALVLRAAQLIAGEIVLSRVVSRLMRIVLENSGAERGVLLLARNEDLLVEATFQASPESIDVGQRRPLADETDLPQQVVLHVWRTREVLAMDDAPGDLRFASDPYLAAKRTRSILCLPVTYQGRPTGILYLENGMAAGVFTAVRVELLGLLASQAAIAIANAMLVEGIQAAQDEAFRTNQRLEAEVALRTRELEQSNEELTTANEQLARELDDRARAEAERAALREQVVEAQRGRLAELMAPLLPITEDVLVMPIIGTVDAERAAQVMEVALTGAQTLGARMLILDITGMRQVDGAVVTALVSVANALRLLGTEPVLTGVRPDVARTMVNLGTGLEGLTTLSTLRAGIARALARTGNTGRLSGPSAGF